VFYDAQNTSLLLGGKEWFPEFTIPAHMIGRIALDGDTLRYDTLDDDWLKKRLYSGDLKIAHEITDAKWDDLVLTASSEDLQRFAAAHANDDEAFHQLAPLHRVK
ncbi:MAG: hypothetical protein WB949_08160, partial [Candidatus Acidiferrales bacterium]